MTEKICAYCNKAFWIDEKGKTNMKRKYCSQECASDMENERKRERRKRAKAGEKVEFHRECLQCGTKFKTVAYQKVYCCVVCKDKAQSERQKEYGPKYREKAKERKKKKKEVEALHEVNGKALEAGMSYGKYTQMLLIQQMHEEMERSRLSRGK